MTPKFDAVLFDCDGVLVDSEPITNGVLREMLNEQGWALTSAECMRIFIGKAVKDEIATIQAHTGKPVTEAWLAEFRQRRNERLERELVAVPNAIDAVRQIHAAYQGRIACCSGADRGKVELQLAKVGLLPYFEGRIFSGHEMPRSKPAPDVYLAGAAALGATPGHCVVVEDTLTGVTAGVAAGATVFGYCPPEAGAEAAAVLGAAGAVGLFEDMAMLASLVYGH
jgi:HAD superfamily hydrolase (TIGR01509 family)